MKLWQCSMCGKIDYWGPSWSLFSSFIVEDLWPSHCVIVCSEKCQDKAESEHKAGVIALPKFRCNSCGQFIMTRGPIGYKPQPDQRVLLETWKDENKSAADIDFIGAQ